MKSYQINTETTICQITINGYRECHIEPNWLLIYSINSKELILTAFRTGTHSDLLE